MKKLISILFIITFVFSCNKSNNEDDCPSKNEDKGLIAGSIDFGTCIYSLQEKTFIVQDSTEYISLQQIINDNRISEDSCSYPSIDFNEYTLLGQFADATGCTINFNRNVVADSLSKKIDYIIIPQGCGACEMHGYSYNFILVHPKITNDYEILFNGV
jgi:hypothetical protein